MAFCIASSAFATLCSGASTPIRIPSHRAGDQGVSNRNEYDKKRESASKSDHDADDEVIEIVIESEAGQVSWQKITAAIVGEIGIEIPSLKSMVSGKIDLEATSSRWAMFSVNFLLRPAIRIAAASDKQSVSIFVDKREVEGVRKRLGKLLRRDIDQSELPKGRKYGIEFYDEKTKFESVDHLVLIVHGFNSSPEVFKTLVAEIESIQRDGPATSVASFRYRTKDGIEAAAKNFAMELGAFAKSNPDCPITIVTHSMGGIVVREVVEANEFEIDQIRRLIMVAPPNHGTSLALIPYGPKRFESALANIERTKIHQAIRNVVGEVNVAIDDLRPGSEFLTRLNQQIRNPRIEYAIILGDKGVLGSRQHDVIRALASLMQNVGEPNLKQGGKEIESNMKLLDGELVSANGDGVVSLASGTLDGVSDVIKLPFQHRDLCRDDRDEQTLIIQEIIKRIR